MCVFPLLQRQFLTEFDYKGEAANMQEIHDNIVPVFGDKVAIPRPLMHLCSKVCVCVCTECDCVVM